MGDIGTEQLIPTQSEKPANLPKIKVSPELKGALLRLADKLKPEPSQNVLPPSPTVPLRSEIIQQEAQAGVSGIPDSAPKDAGSDT